MTCWWSEGRWAALCHKVLTDKAPKFKYADSPVVSGSKSVLCVCLEVDAKKRYQVAMKKKLPAGGDLLLFRRLNKVCSLNLASILSRAWVSPPGHCERYSLSEKWLVSWFENPTTYLLRNRGPGATEYQTYRHGFQQFHTDTLSFVLLWASALVPVDNLISWWPHQTPSCSRESCRC